MHFTSKRKKLKFTILNQIFLQKQQRKTAEMQDMSGKAQEEKEDEVKTEEQEEAATGSTADENGQVKDAR